MVYKTLNDVPKWYYDAVKRRIDAGACDGKNIPESTARAWTVDDKMNPIYNTVDEVPDYGKPTIQKLVEKGYLQGTGNGLALEHNMLRMLVILDRAGVIK